MATFLSARFSKIRRSEAGLDWRWTQACQETWRCSSVALHINFKCLHFPSSLQRTNVSLPKSSSKTGYEFTPLAEKLRSLRHSKPSASPMQEGSSWVWRHFWGDVVEAYAVAPFSFARAVKLRLCSGARICHVTFQMVSKERLANHRSQVPN